MAPPLLSLSDIRLTFGGTPLLESADLAAAAGATVSREDLAEGGGAGNERTVDVQVNRLRRKIEQDLANPAFLQTVRGLGYRLLLDP